MNEYSDYKKLMKNKINNCITTMECLPILFIGSGMSKRYFSAPNWDELLDYLSKKSPKSKLLAFYKQNYPNNCEIGSKLALEYNEWAWEDGNTYFDRDFYQGKHNPDIFIKSEIASLLERITPKDKSSFNDSILNELEKFKKIRPHAIITTNYDTFLEYVFPEYEPIIGQQILKAQYQSIGEIFKIHGCITNFSQLVFTKEDYNAFLSKKSTCQQNY